jgi:trehalose 6-phosphate phosphatase
MHGSSIAANAPVRPAPPPVARDWALFLDVDGCLLDLAPHPDRVVVPDGLASRLEALRERLGGALALVSGRSLASLDALFGNAGAVAAGLHGLEQRSARGRVVAPAAPEALGRLEARARAIASGFPGAVIEAKGPALALHWRMAPRAAPALLSFADDALAQLPGYRLQPGSAVIELLPRGHGKQGAIAAFLEQAPFRGRVPVFAGDDLTDEAGFALVDRLGGMGVLVGDRAGSVARHALPDPAAVRAWLAQGVAR